MPDPRAAALDDVLIGRMAESLPGVSPPPELAARLRRRLLDAVQASATAKPDSHLTIRAAEGTWTEILPGVTVKMLREGAATRSFLMRLAAGARVPAHAHRLDEECLVLSGDVWLGDVRANAGDFHLARGNTEHGEIHSDGGCLLYICGERYAATAHPA